MLSQFLNKVKQVSSNPLIQAIKSGAKSVYEEMPISSALRGDLLGYKQKLGQAFESQVADPMNAAMNFGPMGLVGSIEKKVAGKIGQNLSKPLPKEVGGLVEEARKYKSAEEFVNNKILYHGDAFAGYSDTPNFVFEKGKGLSLTPSYGDAEGYAVRSSDRGILENGAKVRSFQIKDNAKVLDARKLGTIDGDKMGKVIEDAQKQGYDAVRFNTTTVGGSSGVEEFHVINPKIVKELSESQAKKLQSQLTEIWKKANKK